MTKLTANFYLEELIASNTATRAGIDNTPSPEAYACISLILAPGLQRVRDHLQAPILISSGYRSPELNIRVGSGPSSQHVEGLAADFTSPGYGTPRSICRSLIAHRELIQYDQLIYEGTWVHISFVGKNPRSQVLTAKFNPGGRTTYAAGLA